MEYPQEKDLEETNSSPTLEDENQDSFLEVEDTNSAPDDSYRVLARKYRPQNFSDLLGQETMVQILSNAFESGRIAHAYMLTGVRGIGKTTTARLLARSLNYSSDEINEPTINISKYGEHCKEIMESRHIDVLEMDAASRTGIADIREIIDSVSYATTSARFKIYIIDEVHMLSKSAFNGLLKTLEEPPPHVKFIFATTEVHKIPLTILSRCQRFDLKQLDEKNMMHLLSSVCKSENVEIPDNILSIIGRAASGSARDGLSILDQTITLSEHDPNLGEDSIREMLGLSDNSVIIDLFEAIESCDIEKALALIKLQTDKGADPLNIISSLGEIIHELTLLKVSREKNDNLLLGPENFSRLIAFQETLDVRTLSRFWQMILKASEEIKNSFNPDSALEMVVIRMAYVSDLPTPEEIIKNIDSNDKSKKKNITKQSTKEESLSHKNENKTSSSRIHSFEDIIEVAGKNKNLILKKFLQEDVRLVSFEIGHIDINVESGNEDIIKDLIAKLYEWTDQRWIINVSMKKGDDTIIEKQKQKQDDIITELSNSDEMKKVLEAFPDSEITSVNKIEN
ncbi:MAG: DNA polymerase III subunit gamma/tau [Pseudomonadota bacterium]|nr:DNA polymerase III subunit gamma/tau [Candidatus Neomarinimicrobiota bacterium]MEC9098148.1 DNA polymerase III subunit gamma/tau [Pseudomonadota bacterium]MED5273182.1 DNA polymerase III subunit gamma/tau [Pseudomonadota bacterium]MED5484873.1 DNA polymerase III subunit gamma/tau [Pseudomonadota bacterium]